MEIRINDLEDDLTTLRLLLQKACMHRSKAMNALWKLYENQSFQALPIEELAECGFYIMRMQLIFNKLLGHERV